MALTDRAHSRMVAWLKVAMPLLALFILAALFILPRQIDPSQAIPHAEVDVEALARDPRVSTANYATVTEDGATLNVTAETLRTDPELETRMAATRLDVEIETPDGARTGIRADEGVLDRVSGLLTLRGEIAMHNSQGYDIRTEEVVAALDRTRLTAGAPVSARGPAGTLDAGGLELRRQEDGSYVLVFNDGVKLIYTPDG